MSFLGAIDGVVEVKELRDMSDDGEVDRVGTIGWAVFSLEGFDKRSEYGMLLVLSRREAGILLTQVGYPLPDGREDFRY